MMALAQPPLKHLAKAVFCAPGRNRTYDRQIRRLLLYPLSYGGLGSEVLHRLGPLSILARQPEAPPQDVHGRPLRLI